MKQTIKLTENELKHLIRESVKRLLNEGVDIDSDNYFGGGLPDPKPQTHKYTCEKEVTAIYNEMKPCLNSLADIFNNNDCDTSGVYDKVMDALNFLDTLPSIGKHFYSVEGFDQ